MFWPFLLHIFGQFYKIQPRVFFLQIQLKNNELTTYIKRNINKTHTDTHPIIPTSGQHVLVLMVPIIASESPLQRLLFFFSCKTAQLNQPELKPSFLLLAAIRSPPSFPLSLRNDTHANTGYPCHLPLTSCGSRDHVFSVPWDPPLRTDHLAAPVKRHREAHVYRQKRRPERDND